MKLLVLFVGLLMLSGCAETELAAHAIKQIPFPDTTHAKKSAGGYFKVGRSYRIGGKLYTPKETYNHSETGVASWYGPNFHGKKTANGEIFDQNELTAAHRTLQMPSLVRVTNLENGRSLVVRVNDRGPFSRGRIIDVSKQASELLGFRKQGTAKVRLDLLTEESLAIAQAAKDGYSTSGTEILANENKLRPIETAANKPALYGRQKQGRFVPEPVVQKAAPTPAKIYVQAGSFSNEGNAVRLAENLSNINTTTVQTIMIRGKPIHRVRMGPLETVAQADALLIELSQNGHDDTQIIVD